MNKKLLSLGLISLALATFSVSAFANGVGPFDGNGEGRMMKADNEKGDEIRKAIDGDDYKTFASLVDEAGRDIPTEETFAKMVEAHNLMEEGSFEEARTIMEEVGMPGPGPRGFGGPKRGMMQDLTDEQKATFDEARDLMKSGDQEAAKELLDDAGIDMPPFRGEGHCNGFRELAPATVAD